MIYKVTNLLASFDGECPPRAIKFIFPGFSGELVSVSSNEFTVTFQGETVVKPFQGVAISRWNEQSKTWEDLVAPPSDS